MLSRFIPANFLLIYNEGLKCPKTQKVLTDRLIPSEVCEHFSYLAMKDKTTRFISSFTEISEKLSEYGFPYC
jgi:hypothetical protein